MHESALLVEVEAAEPLVGHWRRRYDPGARLGIPAHVTALFPFRDPGSLGQMDLDTLSRLAAGVTTHEFALVSVDEFPGTVWLRPSPDDWFRQLTHVLWQNFPDCPPYRGEIVDPQPHMTVGQFAEEPDQQRMRQALAAQVASLLPLTCSATALSLFVSDRTDMWTRAARFPFRQPN